MGDWPLVGREAELSRLRPVVIGGAYSGAVIAGGPGVGKTRLALECLRMAERAGMRCVRVAATGSAEWMSGGDACVALRVKRQSMH